MKSSSYLVKCFPNVGSYARVRVGARASNLLTVTIGQREVNSRHIPLSDEAIGPLSSYGATAASRYFNSSQCSACFRTNGVPVRSVKIKISYIYFYERNMQFIS